MTKVSNVRQGPAKTPTPTEEIAASGRRTVTVTDTRGRKITLRKLGPLDQMRLARIVGADGAKNEVYFGFATLAYAVSAINGEPSSPPLSERELEGVVDQLGDEGLQAVGDAYGDNFGENLVTKKDDIKN